MHGDVGVCTCTCFRKSAFGVHVNTKILLNRYVCRGKMVPNNHQIALKWAPNAHQKAQNRPQMTKGCPTAAQEPPKVIKMSILGGICTPKGSPKSQKSSKSDRRELQNLLCWAIFVASVFGSHFKQNLHRFLMPGNLEICAPVEAKREFLQNRLVGKRYQKSSKNYPRNHKKTSKIEPNHSKKSSITSKKRLNAKNSAPE